MKLRSYAVLVLATALAFADTKMSFSDLPSAVKAAAKSQTAGAQIVGASSEQEDGRTTYEVETKVNGKSRDLSFDAAGHLLEVEQEVDLASIPEAARTALQKRTAGGIINKVESVTAGHSVSYEAAVTTKSGKHTEVAVGADGKPHHD